MTSGSSAGGGRTIGSSIATAGGAASISPMYSVEGLAKEEGSSAGGPRTIGSSASSIGAKKAAVD